MNIDYNLLKNGFQLTHNKHIGYYYAVSVETGENGDYQFCTKEFKDTAEELVDFLNTLLVDKEDIEDERDQLIELNKLYIKEINEYEQLLPFIRELIIVMKEQGIKDTEEVLNLLKEAKND